MAFRMGRNCKTYRNTGTFGSPVWVELTKIRDLSLKLSAETDDVSTRGDGVWGADAAVLIKATVSFDMIWDPQNDTSFDALFNSFITLATMEFLILDGPVGTTGSRGLRATCMVVDAERSEKLKEAVKCPIELKPTNALNPPTWVTI